LEQFPRAPTGNPGGDAGEMAGDFGHPKKSVREKVREGV
jgi:hypothetical protein